MLSEPEHLYKAYQAALYAAEKLGWNTVDSFVGNEPRDLNLVFKQVLEVCGFEVL